MAERFRELAGPTLVDVSRRSTSSGRAAAAEALANTFQGVSRVGSDVGGRVSARLGEIQGSVEGEAQDPEFRRGLRAITAFGRAYNSAAETSYISAVNVDIADEVARIQAEAQDDPELFATQAKAYSEGLLAELPDEVAPEIKTILRARVNNAQHQVNRAALATMRDQADATYLGSVEQMAGNAIQVAVATNDPEEADAVIQAAIDDNTARLRALVDDNAITAVEMVKRQKRFEATIDESLANYRVGEVLNDLMATARQSVSKGDAMLAELETRDDLSAAEKDALRTEYREQRNLLSFERSRTFAPRSAEFASRLAGGEFGDEAAAENEYLYNRGAISVDEFQSNAAALARNEVKSIGKQADLAAVTQAFETGRGLDPTNSKHREAVDTAFDMTLETMGIESGSARWAALATEYVDKINILPASAQSWSRVNMLSGDAELALQGATFYDRVADANPEAMNFDADPRINAFATQLVNNAESGLLTQEAYDVAHRNVYELQEHHKDLLATRYREEDVAEKNTNELRSAINGDSDFDPGLFGGAFSSAPDTPPNMLADYERLVRQYYNYTNGDVDSARDAAWNAVRSMYGRTEVNGEPQIMKYAPEKMYPGMTPDVVRADVASVLSEIDFVGDTETVQIVPIPDTERSRGRVWMLKTTDEFGVPDIVRDSQNRPVYYELPLGNDFEAARERVNQQMLDAAAEKRDINQQNDALFRELRETDGEGL